MKSRLCYTTHQESSPHHRIIQSYREQHHREEHQCLRLYKSSDANYNALLDNRAHSAKWPEIVMSGTSPPRNCFEKPRLQVSLGALLSSLVPTNRVPAEVQLLSPPWLKRIRLKCSSQQKHVPDINGSSKGTLYPEVAACCCGETCC